MTDNTSKLKSWRKRHEDEYARVLLGKTKPTSLSQVFTVPGLVLVMGDVGSGKTGLAHKAAEVIHDKKNMPAVLHLPKTVSKKIKKDVKTLIPDWMSIATSVDDWPHRTFIVYDEASQSAHARRSQSADAVDLDRLLGICRQKEQSICFISHHSRKLDVEVIRSLHRIVYKVPTMSHALFERNELDDFTWRALEFFRSIPQGKWLKSNIVFDLRLGTFGLYEFTNSLPSYWSEELSRIFKDISKGDGQKKEWQ